MSAHTAKGTGLPRPVTYRDGSRPRGIFGGTAPATGRTGDHRTRRGPATGRTGALRGPTRGPRAVARPFARVGTRSVSRHDRKASVAS